jgi:hypothetical protein
MKTVSGLLLATALAVTLVTGASAYSFNPPVASVHLHGKMTFTPNEGGQPFTCSVTMELKTKRHEIAAVKFPKENCGVALDDFPWDVAILNANSVEIIANGYSGKGTCDQRLTTFQVNGSGIWTLPAGQCFSGTLKSDPPTTIVP